MSSEHAQGADHRPGQDAGAEAHWETEKHALERLLVRTCRAAEGQDPDLDSALAQLREQLRQGHTDPESLKRLLTLLDQQLGVLDEHRSQRNQRLREALSGLLARKRAAPQFRPERKALLAMEKNLRTAGTLVEGLPTWLTELSELEARAYAADPAGLPRQGLVSRLFGGRSGLAEPGRSDSSRLISDQPPVDPLQLATGAPEEEDQRLRFARRVSQLLDHLLNQVSLSPAAHARAVHVRTRLAQSQVWEELRDALNETSELIIAAVSHNQLEFEAFLTRLDERLQAVQQHFSAQSEASESRRSASEALEWRLASDLKGLGEDIRQSRDFDGLKRSVNQHIESIAGAVRGYRQDESRREDLLAEQVDLMREKLATVEAHSEQMKEQLRQERTRALTDVLTQLPNREAWQERLAFEYHRWQRYQHPVTLCVLDIDLFKRINDSYGHKAGDRVIQLIGRTLQERLRTTDFVSRYGGEEFVLLLPETTPDEARGVIDNLRQHIGELPFHFQGERVSVTCSAGLASFSGELAVDAVFDAADKALYRAKAGGRNRVIAHGDQ